MRCTITPIVRIDQYAAKSLGERELRIITVQNGLSTEQRLVLDKWEKNATSEEEVVSRQQVGKLLRSISLSKTTLELGGRELSRLPPGLDAFSALISLSLPNNRLTKIPTQCFSLLPHLKEVDLSSNQIANFPKSKSRRATLSHLSTLNLSFNRLEKKPGLLFLPNLTVILIGNPCALKLQNEELLDKKVLYDVCCTYFRAIKRQDFTSSALKDSGFAISTDYVIRFFHYLALLFNSTKSLRLLSLLQRTYSLLEEMMGRCQVRQVFYLACAELKKNDLQHDLQDPVSIEFWVANALYYLEQTFCYFVSNPYAILVKNSRRLFASFIAEQEISHQYEENTDASQKYDEVNHFRVLLMEQLDSLLMGYYLQNIEGSPLSPTSRKNNFRELAKAIVSTVMSMQENIKRDFVLEMLYKSRAWQSYLAVVLGNKDDTELPKEMRKLRKIVSGLRKEIQQKEGESEEEYRQKVISAAFVDFILPEL